MPTHFVRLADATNGSASGTSANKRMEQFWSIINGAVAENEEYLEIIADMCTGDTPEVERRLAAKRKAESTAHEDPVLSHHGMTVLGALFPFSLLC